MTNDTSDRDRLLLANFVASRAGIPPEKIVIFLEKATDAPGEVQPPSAEHHAALMNPGRWFMAGLRSGIPQSGISGLVTVAMSLTSRVASGRRLEREREMDKLLAAKRTEVFAAVEPYRATRRTAAGGVSGLPAVTMLPFAREMEAAGARGRWLRARSKTEALSIGEQLGESLRTNVDAAMEAGDAIVEGGDLDDAAARRRMAGPVKRAGSKLSTVFWQAHGEIVLASRAPDSLKAKLKVFFAQVGVLKRRIGALTDEPTISDLLQVVEDVTDLLQIAIAIADEIKRLAATT